MSRLATTLPVLALWGGIAGASRPAQQASAACGLLQVTELEAAIGGKAQGKPTGAKQSVPGMTLDQCSVVLSGPGGATHPVDINIVTHLGMNGAQALMIRNRGTASEPQWKVTGARLEQTTVGKAVCLLTARPHIASHAVCSIPRGEGYVEVVVIGDVSDLPTLATVAALVQKASARL
jgi:hypothetical protein